MLDTRTVRTEKLEFKLSRILVRVYLTPRRSHAFLTQSGNTRLPFPTDHVDLFGLQAVDCRNVVGTKKRKASSAAIDEVLGRPENVAGKMTRRQAIRQYDRERNSALALGLQEQQHASRQLHHNNRDVVDGSSSLAIAHSVPPRSVLRPLSSNELNVGWGKASQIKAGSPTIDSTAGQPIDRDVRGDVVDWSNINLAILLLSGNTGDSASAKDDIKRMYTVFKDMAFDGDLGIAKADEGMQSNLTATETEMQLLMCQPSVFLP
jgi:hypothetical protein